MKHTKVKIGLFGFGCVGYGFYQAIKKSNTDAEICRVVVKNPNKERPVQDMSFCYDPATILEDPEINVVVELIDDAEGAYTLVREALTRGKAVVSANKKMIATHLPELLALQEKYGVPLLYEAACCAAIPIIRNLEEYFGYDSLDSLEGIVNGSTNYILTRAYRGGLSFQEALDEAVELGYAESDSSLDTGGYDAYFKLRILAAHAFGLLTGPEEVFFSGIDALGDTEFRYALDNGYRIRLLARVFRTGSDSCAGFVLPSFVPADHPLYEVDGADNAIVTEAPFSGRQVFRGKGAGAFPTASAVVNDVQALAAGYHYRYQKLNVRNGNSWGGTLCLKLMLAYRDGSETEFESFFDRVEERCRNKQGGYLIGTIGLASLYKLKQDYGSRISLVLFDVA